MTAMNRAERPSKGRREERARARRLSLRPSRLRNVEILEDRQLLSAFDVTNLSDSGPGSLRQAIVASNSTPGANSIDFRVAGTIQLARSLPAITDTVAIAGSTAPGFTGSPVVTVDFHGTRGLRFARGADGSVLRSLSLVHASNDGVTLDASNVVIQGNDIGVFADGKSPAGNRGDGIRINASSHGDLIGQVDPVSGVTYYNTSGVSMQPVSGWQGIRNASTAGQYLITGTSNANGLLYIGPISGVGGTSYSVNYPGATSTSVYGPDIVHDNVLRLVGSYRAGSNGVVNGFLWQGTTADLTNASAYRTIDYSGAQYTYVHSTMGDLAVGNADGPEGNAPVGTGHAFIYSVSQGQIVANVVYPGSLSTTAYGVWYNGGTSYTIVGGYTKPGDVGPFASGYIVDYDASTGQFSHWTSISAPASQVPGQAFATHFEGISGPQSDIYTLAAGETQIGSGTPLGASVATVLRNPDGSFGPVFWVKLLYPAAVGATTSNSVAGNQAVGIAFTSTGEVSYQATVNLVPQVSNVISANGGNGIGIYGAADNRIAMNNIGTDASGTVAIGNRQNGVLLTRGAKRNFLGGTVSAGNDPTAGVIVRPPQGNLISGNGANGVLINGGSTQNTLSGNFIGTTASGDSALGNRQDGVAIVRANDNQLIGCTVTDHPFVFYNVISGNGGNGLRITNSNNITVHANFLGAGANNTTVVPNSRDGLLVNGTSQNTQVGGVIPLGNVISGNTQNGIEVRDRASGFVSFNTFGGTFAFGGAAPNGKDGILITSSGGNNLIRTCIISGNTGNGIELGGNAQGVQVTETASGTDTNIQSAIPNGGDGILIDGNARDNAIGGFQPSVEPQVTVSANGRYGIEVSGHAHDNVIFHTYIGTKAQGSGSLGNGLGGIFLGRGTASNTIGGQASALSNKIFNSTQGAGVTIDSSTGNALVGDEIANNAGGGVVVSRCNAAGTRVEANRIHDNAGNGVTLASAMHVTVGGAAASAGNQIVTNQGFGLSASGNCTGTLVQGNTIAANAKGNVDLANSQGITYVP